MYRNIDTIKENDHASHAMENKDHNLLDRVRSFTLCQG